MRLLIAREAVDAHLTAAGDLANPKADLRQKATAAVGASGFYAKWLPKLVFGEGQRPTAYREFGPWRPIAVCRTLVAEARPQHLLRDGALAGHMDKKQGFLGRIVDIGAELFAMSASCVRAEAQRAADPVRCTGIRVGRPVLSAGHAAGGGTVRGAVEQHRQLRCSPGGHLLEGRYTWLEEGIIDQSEGTGPWIAHWEPGPSTEANLARRFMTVLET